MVIYLMSGTLWQIGSFDRASGTFTADKSGPFKISAGSEEGIGSCGQVSFQWENSDFLSKDPDFILRSPNFLLKNVNFMIIKKTASL